MTPLQRIIRRARWRLWINRWLTAQAWLFIAAGGLFTLGIIIQRLVGSASVPDATLGAMAVPLAVLAVGLAMIRAAVTDVGLVAAAARLDEAAGLKERLSTSHYLGEDDDPFARAVCADAQRHVVGLDVARLIPVRLPTVSVYVPLALAAAVAAFVWFPVRTTDAGQARDERRLNDTLVRRAEAQVEPVIRDVVEAIRDRHPELMPEVQLSPARPAPLQTPQDVRREALKTIESVRRRVARRRASPEIGEVDEFKRLMRRLAVERPGHDEVRRLAQSLGEGDLQAARSALHELDRQLRTPPATAEQRVRRQAAQRALRKLAERMDKIANDQHKLRDKLGAAGLNRDEVGESLADIERKDDESVEQRLRDKGLAEEQIMPLLRQLQRRRAAQESCRKMARCIKQGAQQPSSDGMKGAGEALAELQSQQVQQRELGRTLARLEHAKDQLGRSCRSCQGTGQQPPGHPCPQCQGTGQAGPRWGRGMAGPGRASEPSPPLVVERDPQQTPSPARQGEVIAQRFIEGDQLAGDVSAAFVDTVISAERDAAEAMAREAIPRQYHHAIRNYFARTREGLPGSHADPPVAPPAPEAGETPDATGS